MTNSFKYKTRCFVLPLLFSTGPSKLFEEEIVRRFPSVDGTAGFWKRVSGNRLYPGPNGGFTFFSGCAPDTPKSSGCEGVTHDWCGEVSTQDGATVKSVTCETPESSRLVVCFCIMWLRAQHGCRNRKIGYPYRECPKQSRCFVMLGNLKTKLAPEARFFWGSLSEGIDFSEGNLLPQILLTLK